MSKFFFIWKGGRYAVGVGLLCIGIILTTETVLGATAQYVPLVSIPALQSAQGSGLAGYLNRIYVITIAIGAIIAFLRIAFAGVKYSMDEVVTHKEDAKADIKGALLGLAILLIPFVVLNTIYPGLTNLDILKNAQTMRVDLTVPVTAPTPVSSTGPVQNADGSTSETFTRDACTARAGTFTVVYSAGTVEYGSCTITPTPTPTGTASGGTAATPFVATLLWSGTGISRQICDQNAAARNGEARYTDTISKCEVWSKP